MMNPALSPDDAYRELARRAAWYFRMKVEQGNGNYSMNQWLDDYDRTQTRELCDVYFEREHVRRLMDGEETDPHEIEVPL